MKLNIIARSFADLFIPGVLKIVFFCLVGYLIGWIGFSWGITHIIGGMFDLEGLMSWAARFATGALATIIAWFLFPLFFPILISFFVDSIATSIEQNDYPALPKPNPPFWPTLRQDLMFTLKALALNLLCLPIYFIPVVNLIVYYALNGYLLGKQYFLMAAGRRVDRGEAESLARQGHPYVFFLGIATMFCATVPLLGLVAPVLGVACMLHLFHSLKKTPQSVILPPK